MQFINVVSRSPYRITIATDVTPDLTAADYVLTRVDGASLNATITNAFSPATNTVELTVSGEGLLDGVLYKIANPVSVGAPSAIISYRQPLNQSQVPVAPEEDPEADVFGIDIDWFADALAANGDTPSIRGRQCMINDLAVISMVNKGEIFHRPDAGAGLKLNVNGPMTSSYVKQVSGSLTREWYKDPRVKKNGVTIKVDVSASTGAMSIYGTVLPVAIDDPAIVKLPGGGT